MIPKSMEGTFTSLISTVVFVSLFSLLRAQQTYVGDTQADCYNRINSTLGFVCNATSTSTCTSYVTFRATDLYDSAIALGYLLGADPQTLARFIDRKSEVEKIPNNTVVTVPLNCSCTGRFYQHNSSYTIKSTGETYLRMATGTFQGLTTCQALIDQNPYESTNLTAGMRIQIPLRCACPSSSQIGGGVKFLMTYLVSLGDDLPTIANRFGVDLSSIYSANGVDSSSTIFPDTPLLIPLTAEPKPVIAAPPISSPPTSPSPPQPPANLLPSSKKTKWLLAGIGIGIGAAIGFSILASLGVFLFRSSSRRKGERGKSMSPFVEEDKKMPQIQEPSAGFLFSQGVRDVLESLAVYKIEDLQSATGNFSENCRIKGSVYRATIGGDAAAVKRMNGDVSNEIGILKQINHHNIIRLSGFCAHDGNTYLVYEFAENGSLSDWLHEKKKNHHLSWKQRVQIAYDVAEGLNYLHNYANPQYIHKDLKGSNILLDANFRAKISNFGLARRSEEGVQTTRHVVGTQGYMAPEYLEHGVVTPKMDVFALGVVILQLLSGKEAAAEHKERGDFCLWEAIGAVLEGENARGKLKEFVDPCLQGEYPLELAFSMALLAKKCVAEDPSYRPSVVVALMSLSKILSSSLDWYSTSYSIGSDTAAAGR